MIEGIGTREMTDDEIRERIESLEEVLDKRSERSNYISYARTLYNIYSSYVEVGFSDDQAFELMKLFIGATIYG